MKEPTPLIIPAFPEWKGQVCAGFSTRIGGYSSGAYHQLNLGFRSGDNPNTVHRNWEAAMDSQGLLMKPLILPKMVHGDILFDAAGLDLGKKTHPENQRHLVEPEGADAIFSRSREPILAVTMADCLTALIFDPNKKTIAAVHAGWRGTRLGILLKTLSNLENQGFINPRDTWVSFGPCLRPISLEVGAEVASQFNPCFIIERAGKFFFDMPACNQAQAIEAGIPNEQIRDLGEDTLTHPSRYFSYRREGQASGRMAAFISLL